MRSFQSTLFFRAEQVQLLTPLDSLQQLHIFLVQRSPRSECNTPGGASCCTGIYEFHVLKSSSETKYRIGSKN